MKLRLRVAFCLTVLVLLIVSPAHQTEGRAYASSQYAGPSPQSPTEIAGLLASQRQVLTLPAQKKKVKRTIDKSERAYDFTSGASRAILFELPTMASPYTLAITSLCNCDGPAKSIFVPNVGLLDAQFGLTHSLDEDAFSGKAGSLKTVIDVDDTKTADRYVLIYTRGDKTGTQLGTLHTFEALLLKWNFPYFRADHGTIEIEVVPRKNQ